MDMVHFLNCPFLIVIRCGDLIEPWSSPFHNTDKYLMSPGKIIEMYYLLVARYGQEEIEAMLRALGARESVPEAERRTEESRESWPAWVRRERR